MNKLDQGERELLESFEGDEWKTISRPRAAARRYEAYARATFKKDRRVNIRLSKRDLDALQKRALEEGIPYQTLIASVLHTYVERRLVERKSGTPRRSK